MNNWVKSGIGVSVAGLIVLIATYGTQLAEALLALWLLMIQMTDSAPLGLASFFLALSLATASRWFLCKWVPAFDGEPRARDFLIDTAALVIGISITLVQMWSGGPQARLSALWLGIGAGLVAPIIYNGLSAAIALGVRALRSEVKL